MKTHHALCLCGAVTLSQFGMADASLTVQSLGVSHATVEFCAQLDPATAAKYREQAALMIQGMSTEELARIRSTDAYKEAYAQAKAALGEMSGTEAKEFCYRFLDANRQAGKQPGEQG